MNKGIDVSHHQGDIDWAELSKHIDFAIIRAFNHTTLDRKITQNIEGAVKNHIPFMLYYYSNADSIEKVTKEIATLSELHKQNPYITPYTQLYIDWEALDTRTVNFKNQSKLLLYSINSAKELGFKNVGWYSYAANINGLTTALTTLQKYPIWIASTSKNYAVYYPHTVTGWQYSWKERIPGIKTEVDADIWYSAIPAPLDTY